MQESCRTPLQGRGNGRVCTLPKEHPGQHKSRESQELKRQRYRERYANDPEFREHEQEQRRKRDQRRSASRYAAAKHDDLAYLYYSPGLRSHKIGHTTNLKFNEINLRRGCWDIQLIDTFPGGGALEAWLHDRFEARRVRGEWFRDLTATEVREAVAEWLRP